MQTTTNIRTNTKTQIRPKLFFGTTQVFEEQFWLLRLIIVLVVVIAAPTIAKASLSCRGHFVNPITDVCWSCLMPISIGGLAIGKGEMPKKRDTKNPKSPLCACVKGNLPIPIPGITVGFWEPVRLVDVTRTPYCLVNLGGIALGSDSKRISSHRKTSGSAGKSFYHIHYYFYPLIYWLELLTDFMCLESGSFDVAYMSEFDITWNDPKMQSLLNPEAILFGNPIARAACSLDCGASTFHMPLDSMFWCAGCW